MSDQQSQENQRGYYPQPSKKRGGYPNPGQTPPQGGFRRASRGYHSNGVDQSQYQQPYPSQQQGRQFADLAIPKPERQKIDKKKSKKEKKRFKIKKPGFKIISWQGALVILLCVSSIFLVGYWGFNNKRKKLIDEQKNHDISQIIIALDDFYEKSSYHKQDRFYPIANCSSKLNPIDFEYTLRLALTGQIEDVDTHSYINPGLFPKDGQGAYQKKLTGNGNEYECYYEMPFDTSLNKYPDDYERCIFNTNKNPNCYLYTSAGNGESYRLAYYSQSKGKFVVYEKFRDESISSKYY